VIWLMVAAGALVGAPARFLADVAISRRLPARRLPWGTILVNVAGGAVLGVMFGAMTAPQRGGLVYAAAGTGFCGAFTTFSTFTWETLALAEDGYPAAALANVALSLTLGLAAAAAGYVLAR
jgi:CrcB protein